MYFLDLLVGDFPLPHLAVGRFQPSRFHLCYKASLSFNANTFDVLLHQMDTGMDLLKRGV